MHLVLSTCSPEAASRLARQLVEERLAACCNVLPGLTSHYWWQERLHEEAESLLIFKVPEHGVKPLMARLKEQHPYEVPEIIAVPVASGWPAYLDWVRASVPPKDS